MKRYKFSAALIAALMTLSACSQNGNTVKTAQTTEDSTVPSALIDEIAADAAVQSGSASYDFDLTTMSGTMVYATIYNMLTDPESYYGKTIKLSGYFDSTYDEKLDARYYFVVIPDATACCSQGMEFIKSGLNYPDDFPESGKDIEITGKFDRYDELGHTYYYVNADSLKAI